MLAQEVLADRGFTSLASGSVSTAHLHQGRGALGRREAAELVPGEPKYVCVAATARPRLKGLKPMPVKSGSSSASSEAATQQPDPRQPGGVAWEYLELLVGVGNEIWDSNGHKMELREIQVGDPRFPRHYYSAAPLLNELGRDGWEVCGIIGDLSTYILVMKRLRAAPESAPVEASTAEPAQRRQSKSVAQRVQSEPRGS